MIDWIWSLLFVRSSVRDVCKKMENDPHKWEYNDAVLFSIHYLIEINFYVNSALLTNLRKDEDGNVFYTDLFVLRKSEIEFLRKSLAKFLNKAYHKKYDFKKRNNIKIITSKKEIDKRFG